MKRLFATDYEILRDVVVGGAAATAMCRTPVRVCVLMNESSFLQLGGELIPGKTVILDDMYHDWLWQDGRFFYFSRNVQGRADVLVVYGEKVIENKPTPGPRPGGG